MKIIISHDVDHLYVNEHYADLVIPKFIARAFIELFSGNISFKVFVTRIARLFTNRWHRINELVKFNKVNNVPATFFFGVSKGKGMVYSNKKATPWIRYVVENGFDAGVHGIAFENKKEINDEYLVFKTISQTNDFGIRMHYLRKNENTFLNLEKAGYCFDSSEYAIKAPYKIGQMWEFPLSLMDGYLFENGKSWQSENLEKVKELTLMAFEKAEKLEIPYFSVLFHDRYFDSSFKEWQDWYMWFIKYMKEKNGIFISYKEAIKELDYLTT